MVIDFEWEVMYILQVDRDNSSHYPLPCPTGPFLSIHLLSTHFFCSYKENLMFYEENLFCG